VKSIGTLKKLNVGASKFSIGTLKKLNVGASMFILF
jgi:hypothetical protein